jgi:hypothetical protein
VLEDNDRTPLPYWLVQDARLWRILARDDFLSPDQGFELTEELLIALERNSDGPLGGGDQKAADPERFDGHAAEPKSPLWWDKGAPFRFAVMLLSSCAMLMLRRSERHGRLTVARVITPAVPLEQARYGGKVSAAFVTRIGN